MKQKKYLVITILSMIVLASCGTKTEETTNKSNTSKVGEFLYAQQENGYKVVHIRRYCSVIDEHGKVERVSSADSLDYNTSFCPRCVDDESYKALSPLMKDTL